MRRTSGGASIITIAIGIAAIVGEVKCIVKFCECDFKEPYKAECIYGIGAISGFGAVIGYLDIKDN